MSVQKLKVSISVAGKLEIEAEGYVGESCQRATQELLEGLGLGPPQSEQLKEEFFRVEPPPKVEIKR